MIGICGQIFLDVFLIKWNIIEEEQKYQGLVIGARVVDGILQTIVTPKNFVFYCE